MNTAHAFRTLSEPRPDWVREFYGDSRVSACTQCGLVLSGTGGWWLKSCHARHVTVQEPAA